MGLKTSKARRSVAWVLAALVGVALIAEALWASARRRDPVGAEVAARAAGSEAVPSRAPRRPRLDPFRGLGAWIDVHDRQYWRNPERAVEILAARRVRTIFLQTANYASSRPIVHRAAAARIIELAHARGMSVVAWYLPDFVRSRRDLRRSLAAVTFETPGGHRFDAFGLDIEANILPPAPRTRRLLWLSDRIRAAVGKEYVLAAITPSPRGMELSPAFWPGFPWAELPRYYDVFVPMAYWTYRESGEAGAYRYIKRSIEIVREETGRPRAPIHMIGGLAARADRAQMRGFVRAVREGGILGASLYDAGTSDAGDWAELQRVPNPSGGAPALRGPPDAPPGAGEASPGEATPGEGSVGEAPAGEASRGDGRPDGDRPGPPAGSAGRAGAPPAGEPSPPPARENVSPPKPDLNRRPRGPIRPRRGRPHREVRYRFRWDAAPLRVWVRGFDLRRGEVEVRLNGRRLKALSPTRPRRWGVPERLDLDPGQLRPGRNVLAFKQRPPKKRRWRRDRAAWGVQVRGVRAPEPRPSPRHPADLPRP